MAPKPAGPVYSTVIEEQDGSLICNCKAFGETGKACVHILAIKMQIQFGSVDDYLGKFLHYHHSICLTNTELETIRKVRGQEAKGQKKNPQKITKGRKHQARSDAAVSEELYHFFSNLSDDPDSSDSSPNSNSGDDTETAEIKQSTIITTPNKGMIYICL